MGKEELTGTLYQRNSRWYWKVRLPGEKKCHFFSLKPKGAVFATKDRKVATEIARGIWIDALRAISRDKTKKCNRIADLIALYNAHAQKYYSYQDGSPTSQVTIVKLALQYLNDFCGTGSPESLGPLKLQEFRQTLISDKFSRSYINTIISIIKRMYEWGVSQELISGNIFRDLQTVKGLRKGRSGAKETEKVKPVSESFVKEILPYTSNVISAMIRLQMLTGMRSTELCTMRPCDLNTTKKVWLYKPATHKTAWRGLNKIIPIGPRGQNILLPFLKRKITDYCFTPDESMQGRKGRAVKPRYDRCSYRRAIQYAIAAYKKANNIDEKVKLKFTPHQSRHTAATKISEKMGIEASSTVIGDTIDATKIYAEHNLKLAIKAAEKFG